MTATELVRDIRDDIAAHRNVVYVTDARYRCGDGSERRQLVPYAAQDALDAIARDEANACSDVVHVYAIVPPNKSAVGVMGTGEHALYTSERDQATQQHAGYYKLRPANNDKVLLAQGYWYGDKTGREIAITIDRTYQLTVADRLADATV